MKFWELIFKKRKTSQTFRRLSEKLEERRRELASEFEEKHQETLGWLNKKGINVDEVLRRGTRGALASVAAGMILLSSGLTPSRELSKQDQGEPATNVISGNTTVREVIDEALVVGLKKELPDSNRPLLPEEEVKIVETINQVPGFKVSAELGGNRLNTNYGRIGLEQHLPRYPGETINEHFEGVVERSIYGKSGMTKNRGAFGYFASSKAVLTTEAIEKEKYYAVVQTFAIAGWDKNKAEWYKHRKVLIVNPQNGKAVVAVIADSGPAKFTGKSFGASPEAMDSLGIYFGNYKYPVLLFFIDDTGSSPKLGPI
jgi:hypothetical protein